MVSRYRKKVLPLSGTNSMKASTKTKTPVRMRASLTTYIKEDTLLFMLETSLSKGMLSYRNLDLDNSLQSGLVKTCCTKAMLH